MAWHYLSPQNSIIIYISDSDLLKADTLAEWLRRQTRIYNFLISVSFGSAGSNPAGVDFLPFYSIRSMMTWSSNTLKGYIIYIISLASMLPSVEIFQGARWVFFGS